MYLPPLLFATPLSGGKIAEDPTETTLASEGYYSPHVTEGLARAGHMHRAGTPQRG